MSCTELAYPYAMSGTELAYGARSIIERRPRMPRHQGPLKGCGLRTAPVSYAPTHTIRDVRTELACGAMGLRGTERACGATGLSAGYAMSGTELAYGATRAQDTPVQRPSRGA
eukprot:1928988-Rhodomonas_salina.5